MATKLRLTFASPVPASVEIISLADGTGAIPAGLTFPVTMTGPDVNGAFVTAPLNIPVGVTYSIGYQSIVSGQTFTGSVTLAVPSPTTPQPLNGGYQRVDMDPIAQRSTPILQWAVLGSDGKPLDLLNAHLRLVVYKDLGTGENPVFQHDSTDGSVTVSGNGYNIVSVQLAASDTANPYGYGYWLWNITTTTPLAHGNFPIVPATLST